MNTNNLICRLQAVVSKRHWLFDPNTKPCTHWQSEDIDTTFFIITFSILLLLRRSSLDRGTGPHHDCWLAQNSVGISTRADPRRFATTKCLYQGQQFRSESRTATGEYFTQQGLYRQSLGQGYQAAGARGAPCFRS